MVTSTKINLDPQFMVVPDSTDFDFLVVVLHYMQVLVVLVCGHRYVVLLC